MGYAGGDANLRRYVGNSPTNATDPSGLDSLGDIFWDHYYEGGGSPLKLNDYGPLYEKFISSPVTAAAVKKLEDQVRSAALSALGEICGVGEFDLSDALKTHRPTGPRFRRTRPEYAPGFSKAWAVPNYLGRAIRKPSNTSLFALGGSLIRITGGTVTAKVKCVTDQDGNVKRQATITMNLELELVDTFRDAYDLFGNIPGHQDDGWWYPIIATFQSGYTTTVHDLP